MPFYRTYFRELLKKFKLFTLLKELYFYKKLYGAKAIKSIFVDCVRFFMPETLKNIIKKAFKMNITSKRKVNIKTFHHCLRDNLIHNTTITLAEMLRSGDRNSMAFSIESRIPFLDVNLIEFTLSLPSKYIIRNAATKAILREAMKDIIPSKIANRHNKIGFATPQSIWVENNIKFFYEQTKKNIALTEGFINTDSLKYFENRNNYKLIMIWKLFVFTQWVKIFEVDCK